MPTRPRDRRRVRSARRRAAYHANRARKAASPAQRFKAAEDAVLSAATHARNPAHVARSVSGDVAAHAREAMAHAELGAASAALYEHKLTRPGTELDRLGAALMCLRSAIARLPDTDRDQLYEHYARELMNETRRIENERR